MAFLNKCQWISVLSNKCLCFIVALVINDVPELISYARIINPRPGCLLPQICTLQTLSSLCLSVDGVEVITPGAGAAMALVR